jgi:ComF family protein
MTTISTALRVAGQVTLDFALPPRCGGCGTVVAAMHQFCADCWGGIHWLGELGCTMCGVPLEATDEDRCGRCLADPPAIARTRAAMEYGDVARTLVLKLKYGRKVGVAETLAYHMAPLATEDALLLPVPLHRWRLWYRGFNQSALIAAGIARQRGLSVMRDGLIRTRRTRPLKGMDARARRREVGRAFAVRDPAAIRDRTVMLVDDVLTSGSTSDACARALLKAGAARVELICFARALRPAPFVR